MAQEYVTQRPEDPWAHFLFPASMMGGDQIRHDSLALNRHILDPLNLEIHNKGGLELDPQDPPVRYDNPQDIHLELLSGVTDPEERQGVFIHTFRLRGRQFDDKLWGTLSLPTAIWGNMVHSMIVEGVTALGGLLAGDQVHALHTSDDRWSHSSEEPEKTGKFKTDGWTYREDFMIDRKVMLALRITRIEYTLRNGSRYEWCPGKDDRVRPVGAEKRFTAADCQFSLYVGNGGSVLPGDSMLSARGRSYADPLISMLLKDPDEFLRSGYDQFLTANIPIASLLGAHYTVSDGIYTVLPMKTDMEVWKKLKSKGFDTRTLGRGGNILATAKDKGTHEFLKLAGKELVSGRVKLSAADATDYQGTLDLSNPVIVRAAGLLSELKAWLDHEKKVWRSENRGTPFSECPVHSFLPQEVFLTYEWVPGK